MRRGPDLALAGAATLFGSTFLVVQDAVDDVEPVPFLVARFAIAALVLLPFALHRPGSPRLVRHGAAAGVALSAGFVLQTVGLQYTTTSVSAFLTYLLVVIVPVLSSVLLRRPPLRSTLAGVVVAVAGLVALTSGAGGAAGSSPGRGEVLTVLCALAFAVHIVVLSDVAARHDVLRLNLVQFVVVAGTLVLPALVAGGFAFPASAWAAAAYTGVAVGAVAFGLQVWGQRRVSASRAALVLMLEPVVAALLGSLDGERLGAVGALGAGLILTGILVAEVGGPVLDPPVRPGQPDPSC